MPEESTTPDLVERWRQAAEAAYRRDLDATMGIFAPVVSRLDARPVGSPGRVHERWAFTVFWVEGPVVRVTGRNDINEARAAAERLTEERA